jgi:YHS domain-containing protein
LKFSKFKEIYKGRKFFVCDPKKKLKKFVGNPRASWVRPIHKFIE